MKHIKLYENFKSSDEWKVGDIVVSLETKYVSNAIWLHEGRKYKIIEIGPSYSFENRNSIRVQEIDSGHRILSKYFIKSAFVTLEEWELMHNKNKFNL